MIGILFWCGSAFAQPANDLCAGAIPIVPSPAGTGCGAFTFSSPNGSNGATDSGVPTVCSNPGVDSWFTWTATSTGLIYNDGLGNPGIAVYANCADAAAGIDIDCSGTFAATDFQLSGWAIGDMLIIQIYDFGPTAATDISWCLEEFTPPPPPPNDDCATAIDYTTAFGPIGVEGTCPANEQTLIISEYTDSGIDPTCDFGGDATAWYTWTATANGISFDSGTGGPGLEILEGTCGAFTSVGCLNNTDGIIDGLTIGTLYYIIIWDDGTNGSILNWCIEALPPPPPNDACATATPLPVIEGDACGALTMGTNSSATASGELPIPSCSNFGTGEDVWYSVMVPASGAVNIEMSDAGGPTDWAMSLYSGTCGALTEIDCNDDTNALFPAITATGLTPGDVLLVRVFEFLNNATGPFNICAFSPAAVCDVMITAEASTAESCPGASDGTITISTFTSFGPITFDLTGPVNMTNTTGMFTGLPAGDYTVALNDDGFPAAAGPCMTTGGPITVGGDTQAPVVVCPPNMVVDCSNYPAPLLDVDEFVASGGVVTENCSIGSITFGDGLAGDVCPTTAQQVLTRTYNFTDGSGNAGSCTQTITRLNSANGPIITEIPLDATVTCAAEAIPQMAAFNFDTECVDGTKSVEALPASGTANCPGTRYQFRYTAEDDCGRIATHTQTFTIANDPFTLICPTIDCILDCGLSADEAIAAFDAYTDNAIITSSCNNLDATISFNFNPASLGGCGSQTTVNFTATDPCGRSQNCASTVRVVDTTAPEITGMVPQAIRNCGSFAISDYQDWAENAQNSVEITNNCDNTYTWSFSPSTPNTENCGTGDISMTEVTFTVMDNCGNFSMTSGVFLLKDAPVATNMIVSGHVRTESNETVELVNVNVSGSDANAEVQTLADGYYEFELPAENNYTIVPARNDNPLNGISTMDLIMISRHILGIETLDSPYRLIAADIDQSGTITSFDIVELRKLILMINDEFSNNTSWRFIDGSYVFANPTNPFGATFPTEYNINDLIDNMIADFVAIKVGDVNGSAVPSQLAVQGDSREDLEDLVFQVADRQLQANETYTVDFKAKDFTNVLGYQLTLEYDAAQLELVNYTSGELKNLSADNFAARSGVLTSSWNLQQGATLADDAVVFSVTFKANSKVELSKAINVSSRLTKAEAYNQSGSLMNLGLDFTAEKAEATFALLQNQPNPFSNQTLIGFNLPETSFATLTIYDVAGRILKQYTGDFAKGYNEVSVSRSDLSATGLLFYKLETATETATKKMIVN